MNVSWRIEGEFIANCSCEIFCPCVVSLGRHHPTKGYCNGWMGVHIASGNYGDTSLDGLSACLLVDVPHSMGQGNWQAGLYIADKAGDEAAEGLEMIFTGRAGGPTALFGLLIGEFLGVKREPINFQTEGRGRRLTIGNKLKGTATPIPGAREGENVVISNSKYWIAPEIVVCQAEDSRVRDFGRVWNLSGLSGEICKVEWSGP